MKRVLIYKIGQEQLKKLKEEINFSRYSHKFISLYSSMNKNLEHSRNINKRESISPIDKSRSTIRVSRISITNDKPKLPEIENKGMYNIFKKNIIKKEEKFKIINSLDKYYGLKNTKKVRKKSMENFFSTMDFYYK